MVEEAATTVSLLGSTKDCLVLSWSQPSSAVLSVDHLLEALKIVKVHEQLSAY